MTSPRLILVRGDHMQPTLRHDRDYVLVVPAAGYSFEALYVLEIDGIEVVYRCQRLLDGSGRVRLLCDSPAYSGDTVEGVWFDAHLVGRVLADVKMHERISLAPSAPAQLRIAA